MALYFPAGNILQNGCFANVLTLTEVSGEQYMQGGNRFAITQANIDSFAFGFLKKTILTPSPIVKIIYTSYTNSWYSNY